MASKCADFAQSREDRLQNSLLSRDSGRPDRAFPPGTTQWSCQAPTTGSEQLAWHSRYVLPSASGADQGTAATWSAFTSGMLHSWAYTCERGPPKLMRDTTCRMCARRLRRSVTCSTEAKEKPRTKAQEVRGAASSLGQDSHTSHTLDHFAAVQSV